MAKGKRRKNTTAAGAQALSDAFGNAFKPKCSSEPKMAMTWSHEVQTPDSKDYHPAKMDIRIHDESDRANICISAAQYRHSVSMLRVPDVASIYHATSDDLRCMAQKLNAAADQMEEWTND